MADACWPAERCLFAGNAPEQPVWVQCPRGTRLLPGQTRSRPGISGSSFRRAWSCAPSHVSTIARRAIPSRPRRRFAPAVATVAAATGRQWWTSSSFAPGSPSSRTDTNRDAAEHAAWGHLSRGKQQRRWPKRALPAHQRARCGAVENRCEPPESVCHRRGSSELSILSNALLIVFRRPSDQKTGCGNSTGLFGEAELGQPVSRLPRGKEEERRRSGLMQPERSRLRRDPRGTVPSIEAVVRVGLQACREQRQRELDTGSGPSGDAPRIRTTRHRFLAPTAQRPCSELLGPELLREAALPWPESGASDAATARPTRQSNKTGRRTAGLERTAALPSTASERAPWRSDVTTTASSSEPAQLRRMALPRPARNGRSRLPPGRRWRSSTGCNLQSRQP